MASYYELRDSLLESFEQLKEVKAVLEEDPDNAELLQLRGYLEQVVEINQKLTVEALKCETADQPCKKWDVGDKCLAQSSNTGRYRLATVEDVTEDMQEVSVVFDHDKTVQALKPQLLREVKADQLQAAACPPRKHRGPEGDRRRKLKRQQFYRKLEQEREAEKHRWQNFLHGNQHVRKTTTKSIFASPDTQGGRVGIGTCGQSGRPMTEFHTCSKPLKRKAN